MPDTRVPYNSSIQLLHERLMRSWAHILTPLRKQLHSGLLRALDKQYHPLFLRSLSQCELMIWYQPHAEDQLKAQHGRHVQHLWKQYELQLRFCLAAQTIPQVNTRDLVCLEHTLRRVQRQNREQDPQNNGYVSPYLAPSASDSILFGRKTNETQSPEDSGLPIVDHAAYSDDSMTSQHETHAPANVAPGEAAAEASSSEERDLDVEAYLRENNCSMAELLELNKQNFEQLFGQEI